MKTFIAICFLFTSATLLWNGHIIGIFFLYMHGYVDRIVSSEQFMKQIHRDSDDNQI